LAPETKTADADAAFIAACSPDAVLGLIERAKQAEADAAQFKGPDLACHVCGASMGPVSFVLDGQPVHMKAICSDCATTRDMVLAALEREEITMSRAAERMGVTVAYFLREFWWPHVKAPYADRAAPAVEAEEET